MIDATSLILVAALLGYSPSAADDVARFYLIADVEAPDSLPAEVGAALVRFQERSDLWRYERPPLLAGVALQNEIEWTRSALAENLPDLAHLQRLPTEDECKAALVILAGMRHDLNRLEAAAPFLLGLQDQIAATRGEIDSVDCFFFGALCAHKPSQPFNQRRQLDAVRRTLRPDDWIVGNWPAVPFWLIPRSN